MPSPPESETPLQPALDLQRSLLLRAGWLGLLLLLLLIGLDGWTLRREARAELPGTAQLAARLLDEQLARASGSFDRETLNLDLGALDALAARLPICLKVMNLHTRTIVQRCDSLADGSAAGRWLGARLREADGDRLRASEPLLLPGGIQAATVELAVHWDSIGEAWWRRLRNWLLLAGGLAILVLAVTLPVGRALRPAQAILAALARLEAGERGLRVPVPQLRELREVATRFNHLAERWETLLGEQRRLAARLLDVREEERRHLARELHDELGQSLSALRAESTVLSTLAERSGATDMQARANRIASLGAQLLEGLQTVLADLRPPALDRFGLPAALEALIAQPRLGRGGAPLQCTLALPDDARLERLPAAQAVHVYRIVQEALTNVARHGDASRAEVRLDCANEALLISVGDDGRGGPDGDLEPGHGLLGMRERVGALAGSLAIERHPGGGLSLHARLPIIAGAAP